MQTPAFNTWTIGFLIVSAIALFLSLVLFIDRKSRRHNWPIALLLFGFGCILIYYVGVWTGYRRTQPFLFFPDTAWYLAFGPLIYTYTLRFYNTSFKVNYTHFILPALIFVLSIYYLLPTQGYVHFDKVREQAIFKIFWNLRSPWVGIVSLFIYLGLTRDTLRFQADNTSKNQGQEVRHRWFRYVLGFYTLFCLAYLSYYVLVLFPFFNPNWDYAISITMALGIYGVGYMAYTESRIFNGELLTHLFIPKAPQQEAQLTEATKTEFYNQLITHVETNKPYLDYNLRLVHLADQLGFSIHLLSQLINEKAAKNF